MNEEHKPKCIIAHGTIRRGFSMIGPFDDYDAAEEYADGVFESDQYQIMQLAAPEA